MIIEQITKDCHDFKINNSDCKLCNYVIINKNEYYSKLAIEQIFHEKNEKTFHMNIAIHNKKMANILTKFINDNYSTLPD
jgi:hypothetical protein